MQICRTVRAPLCATAPTALLMAMLFARPAFAYIDPGTYQTVWMSLAPLVGILVGFVAVLMVPLLMMACFPLSVPATRSRLVIKPKFCRPRPLVPVPLRLPLLVSVLMVEAFWFAIAALVALMTPVPEMEIAPIEPVPPTLTPLLMP